MIALIDIGNTRAKYTLVTNAIRSKVCFASTSEITNTFLSINFENVTKFVIASVSHEDVTAMIKRWCDSKGIEYIQVLSEFSKLKVKSGYDTPAQLGVDRWLALIGAAQLYPKANVLIIDAGTATTVDFMLNTGEHRGGWILAGIETLISSVSTQTAQVKANRDKKASIDFGLNTTDNVNNAAWGATVGMINLAIMEIQKQGEFIDQVIITGGNGASLLTFITHPSVLVDDLVFIGLQAYI